MPLPNTRLIHRQFEEWGRRNADGQCTAWCRVTDPDGVLVYDGSCRIQQAGPAGLTPVAADQRITAGQFTIVVPASGLHLTPAHAIEVVDCPGDPELIGRQFLIHGVTRGSIRWQQTLSCTLHDQPAQ